MQLYDVIKMPNQIFHYIYSPYYAEACNVFAVHIFTAYSSKATNHFGTKVSVILPLNRQRGWRGLSAFFPATMIVIARSQFHSHPHHVRCWTLR